MEENRKCKLRIKIIQPGHSIFPPFVAINLPLFSNLITDSVQIHLSIKTCFSDGFAVIITRIFSYERAKQEDERA